MNGPKIVIIVVLVLVLLLFVCGTGLGVGNNSKPAGNIMDQQDSWVNGLRQSLAPAQTLKIQDVEKGAPPGCIQQGKFGLQFVIKPNKSCTFTVQSSFLPVRKQLSMTLSAGSLATIELTPNVEKNKAGLKVTQTLSTIHPVITQEEMQKLEVYKDGGTLLISCFGTAECWLDVG